MGVVLSNALIGDGPGEWTQWAQFPWASGLRPDHDSLHSKIQVPSACFSSSVKQHPYAIIMQWRDDKEGPCLNPKP